MDAVIIKDGNLYIACSILPPLVFGWANDKNTAISRLNDNLYDYCNWLCKPLPKEPASKIIKQYEGRLCKIAVEGDQKQNLKRIAEITMQTAFSFKSMLADIELSGSMQKQIDEVLSRYKNQGDGILEIASGLIEEGDVKAQRAFNFEVYKKSKEIYFELKAQGLSVNNAFCFDL